MSEEWPDLLVVMALPVESQEVLEGAGITVLYTGVGKVNATLSLGRRLTEYRCAGRPLPTVVNFGSAGSHRYPKGTVVKCQKFVQRDFDASALGFLPGVTPFDAVPAVISFDQDNPADGTAVCGTGDSFETGPARVLCDVVDMEAYALAKVCWVESARFVCIKYITDGADTTSAEDWTNNLHLAGVEFLHAYQALARSASR
jgi:adenosylhomocysteine nucleosidase